MESCNPTKWNLATVPCPALGPGPGQPPSPFSSKSCKTLIFGFSGLENLKMESCNPALLFVPCPCALCPAPCLRPCPAPCPALCLGPALRPWPWPKVANMLFLRFSGLENLKMESCNPTNGILQPYPALCALPLRALPALPCPCPWRCSWPCAWSWPWSASLPFLLKKLQDCDFWVFRP